MSNQEIKEVLLYLLDLQKAHTKGQSDAIDEFSRGYHNGAWWTCCHAIEKISKKWGMK